MVGGGEVRVHRFKRIRDTYGAKGVNANAMGTIYAHGSAVGPARAAPAHFPYAHRTMAEIDVEHDERHFRCEAVMKGPKW